MRVSSAFSRLVRLPGCGSRRAVRSRSGGAEVALRSAGCGARGVSSRPRRARTHGRRRRSGASRSRRLAAGDRCRRRRLRCPRHGVLRRGRSVRAPPAPVHARLRVLVAWLAARTDKTAICRLLRVDWDTVGRIIDARVRRTSSIPTGCARCTTSGVDEVSWKRQRTLPHAGRRPPAEASSCGAATAPARRPPTASSPSSTRSRRRGAEGDRPTPRCRRAIARPRRAQAAGRRSRRLARGGLARHGPRVRRPRRAGTRG